VNCSTSSTFSAMTGTAAAWIAPLATGWRELGELDLEELCRFDTALRELLARFPIDAGVQPALRSERLLRIRHELATGGHLAAAVPGCDGGSGRPVLIQTMMQFICGYHDIDLRDATGLGHGRLIAGYASALVRDRWLPRLLAGELAGIAVTETQGGSQVHAITTAAVPRRDGGWTVSGTKSWISRLDEAVVFCVFFKDPAGRLTAGVVNADATGLYRRPVTPAGLSGWAWGELHLDGVRLRRRDILAHPGEGMDLLREHFAHYRPLVAATALGAAAAACDFVAAHLDTRRKAGLITGLRDNALITLGRAYAQINAAMLAALTAQRLSQADDDRAELWGCAAKAHGVDVAYAATADLSLLVGAPGFAAASRLAKARRDLNGLLYADGIHDSLYRAAGRTLITSPGSRLQARSPSRPLARPRRQ
jgi:alkylation response protein AidB-like acyl-CoA dehydrogenase